MVHHLIYIFVRPTNFRNFLHQIVK